MDTIMFCSAKCLTVALPLTPTSALGSPIFNQLANNYPALTRISNSKHAYRELEIHFP